MSDTEKKDLYIAAAVGGLGLVLIYLYIHFGSHPATGDTVPATQTQDGAQTPYNYNVVPFNPNPPITQTKSPAVAATGGGGCCDTCGPFNGSAFQNVNTAQFTTLLGTGAA